jgi:hypothetical protein
VIGNISRVKAFLTCQQLAYNWDELRLIPHRDADPLVIGEAYHLGSEFITKFGDINQAVQASEDRIRERIKGQMILPEELPQIERNIEFVRKAVYEFGINYDKADYTVLWPEVTGCIPLPGTEHHCWFCHKLLFPNIPFDACYDHNYADENGLPKCYQPHYFKFRTDGVIEMYKKLWLLEQKTASRTGSDFFLKFQLDMQVRGYAYGVWKATGVLVTGVLINAIIKHSKQVTVNGQRKYQLDPTNVGFEREPILITQHSMEGFEREFIQMLNDYERVFREGTPYKDTQSCFNYNRKCSYWDKCLRDQVVLPGEFRERQDDYVNLSYYDILGLPKPELKETPEWNEVSSFSQEG